MSGRNSYTKVGSFPSSYRFLRIGDTCIFKATNPLTGWAKDREINGKIIRVHVSGKDPHIIVSIDPTKHSMMSTLYVIYPKGHPEFNFFLKIKGTGLGSKLLKRAKEERDGIFQGDLVLTFGK